jgi:hypothetical protein
VLRCNLSRTIWTYEETLWLASHDLGSTTKCSGYHHMTFALAGFQRLPEVSGGSAKSVEVQNHVASSIPWMNPRCSFGSGDSRHRVPSTGGDAQRVVLSKASPVASDLRLQL